VHGELAPGAGARPEAAAPRPLARPARWHTVCCGDNRMRTCAHFWSAASFRAQHPQPSWQPADAGATARTGVLRARAASYPQRAAPAARATAAKIRAWP